MSRKSKLNGRVKKLVWAEIDHARVARLYADDAPPFKESERKLLIARKRYKEELDSLFFAFSLADV